MKKVTSYRPIKNLLKFIFNNSEQQNNAEINLQKLWPRKRTVHIKSSMATPDMKNNGNKLYVPNLFFPGKLSKNAFTCLFGLKNISLEVHRGHNNM